MTQQLPLSSLGDPFAAGGRGNAYTHEPEADPEAEARTREINELLLADQREKVMSCTAVLLGHDDDARAALFTELRSKCGGGKGEREAKAIGSRAADCVLEHDSLGGTRVNLVTFSTSKRKASRMSKQFKRLQMFNEATAVIFSHKGSDFSVEGGPASFTATDHLERVCRSTATFGSPAGAAVLVVVCSKKEEKLVERLNWFGKLKDRIQFCRNNVVDVQAALSAIATRHAKRAGGMLAASAVESVIENVVEPPPPPPSNVNILVSAFAAGCLAYVVGIGIRGAVAQ